MLMKTFTKTTLLFVFLFGLGGCFQLAMAQDEGAPQQNASTVNYTVGDLEKMDKLELTTIYIEKIKRLQEILPFIPFQTLEPTKPNDLRVPATSANDKALGKLQKAREGYNDEIDNTLNTLVPYSNKDDLVGAILFVQDFINKVELIGLGMNNLGY